MFVMTMKVLATLFFGSAALMFIGIIAAMAYAGFMDAWGRYL